MLLAYSKMWLYDELLSSDVPEDALALSRTPQANKEGMALKLRSRMKSAADAANAAAACSLNWIWWKGSDGNPSNANRRVGLSIRFFGDDVVYAPKERPAPRYPGTSALLRPGEPLRGPWFPQVYPRPSS